MRTLFVIDIDGTIADASRRFAEAGPEPSREDRELYTKWVEAVQNAKSLSADNPIPGMRDLISGLYLKTSSVIYLTSREERWRGVTVQWMFNHYFTGQPDLVMRPNDNWEPTGIFKERMILAHMARTQCSECVVIDDDPRGDVSAVCRNNGWTFLKAGG